MADVQPDQTVRIANELFEALYRTRIPGRHKDVLFCVIRFTYGWRKTRDSIAISQIAKGTEIDERGVRRILADLVSWGMIGREDQGRNRSSVWWPVKDYDLWKPENTEASKSQLRARMPGRTDPGEDDHPGRGCPGMQDETPGEDDPSTPGEDAPLQRHNQDKTKDSGEPSAPAAPVSPEVTGFIAMLKGEIPTGLDGKTWTTREAWFEDHREILIGEAQVKAGTLKGEQFNGAFRSSLMRFWNNKRPRKRSPPGRPAVRTGGVSSHWEHG